MPKKLAATLARSRVLRGYRFAFSLMRPAKEFAAHDATQHACLWLLLMVRSPMQIATNPAKTFTERKLQEARRKFTPFGKHA